MSRFLHRHIYKIVRFSLKISAQNFVSSIWSIKPFQTIQIDFKK